MKRDVTTRIYDKVFNVKENHNKVNEFVKAIILEFSDRIVIVENDNFGTKRKYADFTEGKKKAGLNPLQIVFTGIENEKLFHTKYVGGDNKVHTF